MVSCEAENRNGDKDSQDNIRGNNAHYGTHIYNITGTTLCERETTKGFNMQHHVPASHTRKRFRKARYLAVLLQILKDRRVDKRQVGY